MSTIAQYAKAIFLEAVENHPPDQWPAFLDEKCGEDRDLRQRVEGLLQAHQDHDNLFDHPDPTADFRPLRQPGQTIGPYKLRERLGEGGMGVVWAAEQRQPLRRKVAIKLIKPGMDTEQVLARFELEREALSRMDHPNIARVLDAGTTQYGHPYFVMELIRGAPITEYCDVHKMTVHQRLRLFIQVCKAVQHAHQKGIIHRDIKPLNVLVTETDGEPVPKVIDFGVAKALHQSLSDKAAYSGVFQAIGTMAYMAPEQAGLSSSDVDSRADVYGLGALLYELLTGKAPFDTNELATAALDEACRIIRQKEPPAPSATISTLGARALSVSGQRGTTPKSLGRVVRGELDWIAMTALEKDRNRRYESASGMADDVARHLSGVSVSVSPRSTLYRLTSFCRRNRTALTVTTVVVSILLISTVASAMLALRFNEQNVKLRHSQIELETAKKGLEDINKRLEDSNKKLRASQHQLAQASYSRAMRTAYTEWAQSNPEAAIQLLNDLRSYKQQYGIEPGIEWRLLWNQLQEDSADFGGTTLVQTNPFVTFGFSVDGRRLAVPIPESGVAIFDLLKGERTNISFHRKDGEESQPLSAIYSREGSLLAVGLQVGDNKGRVNVIHESGDIQATIELDFPPSRLTFSATGNELKAGTTRRLRQLQLGLRTIWNPSQDQSEQAVNSDNREERPSTIQAIRKGKRAIQELDGGMFRRQITENVDIERFRLSPNGAHIATLSLDGRLKLWQTNLMQSGLTKSISHWHIPLAAHPRLLIVAMPGEDGSVRLWNPVNGESEWINKAHDGYVAGIVYSHDGSMLLTGGFDGKLKLWNALSHELVREFDWQQTAEEPVDAIWGVAFSTDDSLAGAAGGGGRTRVWEVASGKLVNSTDDEDDSELRGLDFLHTNNQYVTCSGRWPSVVKLWRVDSEDTETVYEGRYRVDCARVSPDGNWIAVADRSGYVVVFSATNRKEVWRSKAAGSYIASVSFSHDSARLICVAEDGISFFVRHNDDWIECGRLCPVQSSFRQATLMANDAGLVTASRNGLIRYWPINQQPELD